jgi:hypothetical protein
MLVVGTASTSAVSRLRRLRTVLLLLGLGCLALVFRQAVVIAALKLLPPVDLAQSDLWLVDWRLAALRYSPDMCSRVLRSPHIVAQPIADATMHNGCGWANSVRLAQAGGVRASFDKITCESAAALALWLKHDVQPLAHDMLGQRVTGVQTLGAYSCRNVVGNPLGRFLRSEHATANAVDIRGFVLTNGRAISVRSQWHGDGNEARFLKAVHGRACRYFHVVLGPDYNAAHRNHFHLDRGPHWHCQ